MLKLKMSDCLIVSCIWSFVAYQNAKCLLIINLKEKRFVWLSCFIFVVLNFQNFYYILCQSSIIYFAIKISTPNHVNLGLS